MIVRTWRQARRASTLTRLVVATDDPRIRDACESAGAEVVMTSGDLPNGTERCAAAHEALGGGFDVVVNIQGDEPLIDPSVVDDVVRALQASPDAVYSTVATNLRAEEVTMRSRVKVVVDQLGYAIYFSRSVIPGGKSGEPDASFPYLLHLGLQCYDAAFLRLYPALPATPLQTREDLEQLKVIEHGYRMRVVTTAHAGHGVDEPEDVAKVEAILRDAGEA
jgi:3-deoxy-manno-octulosonate cytidylyltransferase (CMP-KDO synthetase)